MEEKKRKQAEEKLRAEARGSKVAMVPRALGV